MTTLAIILCVVCQFFMVVGQVLFKRAMDQRRPQSRGKSTLQLILGIAAMTLWFFLWIGLLQQNQLSKIFPFEGLNPAILVLASMVLLKERLPWISWIGIACITVGIIVVSGS